ncbi:MFS transporter [Agromyces aurantiacus]|uniref:MFS transporter n=1 Tax=Agromyces aurantiacus TaxID=165814 RepID=A0ABV9R8T7_9MICO|nr:MFS transporter [Agromyces aurantiacus]MBM7505104.1 MFS family permease [Agromyces aurantiacus]
MDTTLLTPAPSGRTSRGTEHRRPTLSRKPSFVLTAGIVGLGLFASVTPSPIYPTYQAAWDLSPLTLTLVYATYAIGVLLALLIAGTASDEVGRRPVLLVAVAGLIAATILSALAPGVVWLVVARAVQGIATGLALSTAGAALLDLHPRRDAAAAGLANGVASSVGIALGVLVASLLVQYDWAPRVLPYLAQLAFLAVAAVGVMAMPETVARRGGLRWRIRRPSVPIAARGPFTVAALAVTASWSLGGLLFSLGPALGAELFDTADVILSSACIVALASTATISQLVFRRLPPRQAAAAGSAALAIGVALISYSAATGSGAVFLIGAAVSGLGFGTGFLGGLRLLTGAIPAAERAAIMAAFYLVAYLALSIPAVLAGVLVGVFGVQVAFQVIGAPIAVLALVTAVVALRRSRRHR